jgi:hypothetical protein
MSTATALSVMLSSMGLSYSHHGGLAGLSVGLANQLRQIASGVDIGHIGRTG